MSRDMRCGYKPHMPNDTIAVLDATSAHLSVFAIRQVCSTRIEAYLANLGYALNNCEWQIITSMNIGLSIHEERPEAEYSLIELTRALIRAGKPVSGIYALGR